MTREEKVAQLKAALEAAKKDVPVPSVPKPRQACEAWEPGCGLEKYRCFCGALLALAEGTKPGDQIACCSCDRYYVVGEPFARRDAVPVEEKEKEEAAP